MFFVFVLTHTKEQLLFAIRGDFQELSKMMFERLPKSIVSSVSGFVITQQLVYERPEKLPKRIGPCSKFWDCPRPALGKQWLSESLEHSCAPKWKRAHARYPTPEMSAAAPCSSRAALV
jgi:hypothetical protein